MMKRIMITLGMVLASTIATFATPTVTDVVAKQRYPWNGLVDITCKVTGINGTTNGLKFAVAAVMPDTGNARRVSKFWVMQGGTESTDRKVHTNGKYRLVWDAKAELGPVSYDNMVMRVTVVDLHEKVQLWEGGPYWATTNIGAENPEDYGYYFWWGDTVGYARSGGTWNVDYGWYDGWADISVTFYYDGVTWGSSTGQQMSSSPFVVSSCPTYGKDNAALRAAGYIDSTGNLVAAHDAATAHLGAPWRMPTLAEIYALRVNCTVERITINGVSGLLVTGKGSYANRSIFLPAAGYGIDSYLFGPRMLGYYWSSTPSSDNSDYAWGLGFYSSIFFYRSYSGSRCYGQSVRPVRGFAE